MKKGRMKRLLAATLAGCTVFGAALAVSAVGIVGDVDGDGKINVFDAQILAEAKAGHRQLTNDQKRFEGDGAVAAILDFVRGVFNMDVGDLNDDGVYEIYRAEGLRYMAEHPDGNYELKANLDLGGAVWQPIRGFSGTFEGNGYTISNLTITADDRNSVGFFGDTTEESVVNDLALRNVTLYASGNVQYIGLIAGTSRGTMTGFTATGEIYDSRTSMPSGTDQIVVGALFGRTVKNSGAHVGGSSVSVTDGTGNYTVTGLCADVKMYIEKDSDLVWNKGLVGYLYSGTSVTGMWSDSTTDSSKLSETIQARQQEVVDYMNAMASVAWTVTETLTYEASGVHHQVFEPGQIYYGLPYNGRNGSLERFESCVASEEDGIKIIKSGLGDSVKNDGANMTGFAVYMGNDCSSAVCQAWARVSPVRVSSGYKMVNGQVIERNPNEYAGGAYVVTTDRMIPSLNAVELWVTDENNTSIKTTITYQQKYGIYPVGDWTTVGQQGTMNADEIVGTFAYDTLAIDALNGNDENRTTAAVTAAMGDDKMAEAYAVAHKADAIVCGDPSGHARLLVADPVVIRSAYGTIDRDQSFLVCTEQGDGLYDTDNNTSWRINHKWSFNNLLGYKDSTLPEGYGYSKQPYLPITIRALHADYVKAAYVDEAVVTKSPASGELYSNWRILKTTIIVQDMMENELFRHEAYVGLEGTSNNDDYYRSEGNDVRMAYAHGEAFNAFAQENLIPGQTYRYSVQMLLSNGETKIVSRDSLKASQHSGEEFDTFVYTPAQ